MKRYTRKAGAHSKSSKKIVSTRKILSRSSVGIFKPVTAAQKKRNTEKLIKNVLRSEAETNPFEYLTRVRSFFKDLLNLYYAAQESGDDDEIVKIALLLTFISEAS